MGDELKRVARDRASAAKKGKSSDSVEKDASRKTAKEKEPIGLVKVASDSELEKKPTSKKVLAAPTAAERINSDNVAPQNNKKYHTLVENEIESIVKSISAKLRHDYLSTSAIENISATSTASSRGKVEIT